ncbi:MAG: hypothetical protein ABFD82_11155 [Syntrophaceae bacterium]
MKYSSIRYCPSCGKKLEKVDIIDANADGYKCENGHCLHSLKQEVYTAQTMGSYLALKSGKESPEDIFREWLSNPGLRSHLNDNLANVLRFILETRNGKQNAAEPYSYDYCTTCGEKLQDVPSDDLYVAILKCANDHTFLSRGGLRSVGGDRKTGIFSFDYDEKYFQMSYKSWLENKHFQQYVPHELKNALRSISLNK